MLNIASLRFSEGKENIRYQRVQNGSLCSDHLNLLSICASLILGLKYAICDIIIILGQQLWFNQAHAHHASYYNYMYPKTWGKSGIPFEKYPFHTYYGDGSEINEDVLQVKSK